MTGHGAGSAFSERPFIAIWETTRSCGLACRHCRAEAMLGRDPSELTTAEGADLLRQAGAMRAPVFILSGGDPLNRPDLEELVAAGKEAGLRVGTIPAATSNLTAARVRGLKAAGLDQMAFSLDAASAGPHDSFRQAPGAFDKTIEGIAMARAEGIPVQVNTCLAAWNLPLLEDLISLVSSLGVVFWEVFFLIPVGRGRDMEAVPPARFEEVFARFHRLSKEVRFVVKLAEAQHYRRYVILAERAAGGTLVEASARAGRILARPRGPGGSLGLSPESVNAGKGFVFIDHLGNICPSGFLPIPVANVREARLADAYRSSRVFLELRDPRLLKGKCGACDFAGICGGSRARAYAMTGDYLETDPACAYVPPGWKGGR